jgi:hypothetical protein
VRHNQALFSETPDARQYGWIDENCNSSAIGLIALAEMNTSGFFRETASALLKRSSFLGAFDLLMFYENQKDGDT